MSTTDFQNGFAFGLISGGVETVSPKTYEYSFATLSDKTTLFDRPILSKKASYSVLSDDEGEYYDVHFTIKLCVAKKTPDRLIMPLVLSPFKVVCEDEAQGKLKIINKDDIANDAFIELNGEKQSLNQLVQMNLEAGYCFAGGVSSGQTEHHENGSGIVEFQFDANLKVREKSIFDDMFPAIEQSVEAFTKFIINHKERIVQGVYTGD